jgi:hypothetical protein
VPPDQVDVIVSACPLSIVGFVGLIDGVPRAEFTVTVIALEVTGTGALELSFTCSSKLQVPVVDRAPVETVGVAPGLHPNELPRSV